MPRTGGGYVQTSYLLGQDGQGPSPYSSQYVVGGGGGGMHHYMQPPQQQHPLQHPHLQQPQPHPHLQQHYLQPLPPQQQQPQSRQQQQPQQHYLPPQPPGGPSSSLVMYAHPHTQQGSTQGSSLYGHTSSSPVLHYSHSLGQHHMDSGQQGCYPGHAPSTILVGPSPTKSLSDRCLMQVGA